MPSIGIPSGAAGTAEFTHFALERVIAGSREPFYGRAIDGNVVLSAAGANINSSILGTASGGRTVDAPKTAVSGFSSAQLTVTSSTNFRAGDYCILINLQGSSTRFAQVGIYELVKISSVDDATHITLTGAPTKLYGQNGGLTPTNSDLTGQKVVLQRIPEYGKVSSSNPTNGSIIASGWDGTTGGIVAFMCHELSNLPGFDSGFAPTVSTYGVLVTGAGYRGGSGGNIFTMDAYGEGFKGAAGASATGTGGTAMIAPSHTPADGSNGTSSGTPGGTIGGGGGAAGWGGAGSGGNRLAGPAGSAGGRGGGGGAGGGNAGQNGGSGSAGGTGPGAGGNGNSTVNSGMAGGGTTGGSAVIDGASGKLFFGGGGGGVTGDVNQYGNGGTGGTTPTSNAGTAGGSGGDWSPSSYEKAYGRAGGGIILIWAKTITYSNRLNANSGGNPTVLPSMPWPIAVGTVVNPTQVPANTAGSGPGARGGSGGSGRSGTAGSGAGGSVILIANSLTSALPTIEMESSTVEGGSGQTGIAGAGGGGSGGSGESVSAIPSISSGYGLIRFIGSDSLYASSSPDGTGNYAPSTSAYKASL